MRREDRRYWWSRELDCESLEGTESEGLLSRMDADRYLGIAVRHKANWSLNGCSLGDSVLIEPRVKE